MEVWLQLLLGPEQDCGVKESHQQQADSLAKQDLPQRLAVLSKYLVELAGLMVVPYLALARLFALFEHMLLLDGHILGEDFVLNDVDVALSIEVRPEEAGVLRLAVGIHVDMEFLIEVVWVEGNRGGEEKGKLDDHNRQEALVRVHISVLESNSEEVFEGVFNISNGLAVSSIEASDDNGLVIDSHIPDRAIRIALIDPTIAGGEEEPLRLEELKPFSQMVIGEDHAIGEHVVEASVRPDQEVRVELVIV